MMYKWGHPVATLPSNGGDYASLSQNDLNSANDHPLPRAQTNYAGFRSQPPRAPTAPCSKRAAGLRSQPPDHSPRRRVVQRAPKRLFKVVITRAIGGTRRFEGGSRVWCQNTPFRSEAGVPLWLSEIRRCLLLPTSAPESPSRSGVSTCNGVASLLAGVIRPTATAARG
eukprot:808013-Pleurochrysis_carterae.AAC.1